MFLHRHVKSSEDLEDVFMELGRRAHEAGVSLPHHEGSLRQGLVILYRGHGAYRGNPFHILATTIESQTTTQPERKAIAMELVYYAGFWEMFSS
jgi:hypothetical protein